ncbi:MAG: hypothetical protein WAP52_00725 [Candidatus Sungiibacteriota bacterium]
MSVPTNEIVYEPGFRKDVHDLPHAIQEKLAPLIIVLAENPFNPRLHTKPLNPPLQKVFSFRITRDYRVGFMFDASHTIRLLIADTRDHIYQRLKRKMN